MENVTFVSNSHQRPAADNLQKLKSLLTNTQQQIKSQTQQVTIKNLYVSSFTLVCFRSGKLTISNNHDTIYCDEPGMLVLKKEQVVNVTLEEVNGHISIYSRYRRNDLALSMHLSQTSSKPKWRYPQRKRRKSSIRLTFLPEERYLNI